MNSALKSISGIKESALTSAAPWRQRTCQRTEPALVAVFLKLAIDTAQPLMWTRRGRDAN